MFLMFAQASQTNCQLKSFKIGAFIWFPGITIGQKVFEIFERSRKLPNSFGKVERFECFFGKQTWPNTQISYFMLFSWRNARRIFPLSCIFFLLCQSCQAFHSDVPHLWPLRSRALKKKKQKHIGSGLVLFTAWSFRLLDHFHLLLSCRA